MVDTHTDMIILINYRKIVYKNLNKAIRYWKNLQTHNERCFTSNFVLDEAFTMLGCRAGYKFAVQRARNIFYLIQ